MQATNGTVQADEIRDPEEEIIPCEEADGDDIDLSGGFTGQFVQNSGVGEAEFSIIDYESIFPMNSYVHGPPACMGFCGIVIEFAAVNPPQNYVPPVLENVTLTYWDNGQQLTVTSSYAWAYPHLTIESVVDFTIGTYEIDFAGTHTSGLALQSISLDGGLCVVDNIDKGDPDPVLTVLEIPNNLDL